MTLAVSATAAWQGERNRLLGIAYRMLGDFGHAEDVVSEVAITLSGRNGTPPRAGWNPGRRG
ncbi:hypothetical protein OHC50_11995 [Paenarthrobacter ilicis]|uniref:hypothetical protein n=1 Tax=Paenarthrobacter ilicis TaxID=43665 RepID=UPI00300B9211